MNESKTVNKALGVLESVADGPGTLYDLCRATRLPRATLHRLLATLIDSSYVRYDATDRTYRLGFKLLELGYRAEAQSELVRIARPSLERLRDATDETAQLMIVDGHQGVYIDKAEPHRGFRFWTRIGMRRPLHAGASMRVLLAHLPEKQVAAIFHNRPLPTYTPTTITDPKKLRAESRKIRLKGYCVSFEESHEGAAGVAAPVRDRADRVVAGISVVGPRTRFSKARLPRLIAETRLAARDVSRQLGWREVRSKSPTTDRMAGD